MSEQFSAAEKIAIAGAIKPAELEAAKASLKDGFSESVDLTIRLDGTVQKGLGTPAASFLASAIVNLRSLPAMCALLRLLGVGSKRLTDALAKLPKGAIQPDAEFPELFVAEELRRAKKLPKLKSQKAAIRGAVTSTIRAERK